MLINFTLSQYNDPGCNRQASKQYYSTCINYVRFEAFTAVTMKNVVFWDVALCRCFVNRRFGGTYHHHLLTLVHRSRIFLP
jgi:hypothetical protein